MVVTFDSYEQTHEVEDHDSSESNKASQDLVALKANL